MKRRQGQTQIRSILGIALGLLVLSGCFSVSQKEAASPVTETPVIAKKLAPARGPAIPEEMNQLSVALTTGDRAYTEFLRLYWQERHEVMSSVKSPFKSMSLHLKHHQSDFSAIAYEYSACTSASTRGRRGTTVQKSRIQITPGLRPDQIGSIQYLVSTDCHSEMHLAASFDFHPFVSGEPKLEIRMRFLRSWLSEDFGQFLASKSDPATCLAVMNSHKKLESLNCDKLGQDLPLTRRKTGVYFELSKFHFKRAPTFELSVRGSNFNESFHPTCDFGPEKGPDQSCFAFACKESDPNKRCQLDENLITAEERDAYNRALRDLQRPAVMTPPPPTSQALGPAAPLVASADERAPLRGSQGQTMETRDMKRHGEVDPRDRREPDPRDRRVVDARDRREIDPRDQQATAQANNSRDRRDGEPANAALVDLTDPARRGLKPAVAAAAAAEASEPIAGEPMGAEHDPNQGEVQGEVQGQAIPTSQGPITSAEVPEARTRLAAVPEREAPSR